MEHLGSAPSFFRHTCPRARSLSTLPRPSTPPEASLPLLASLAASAAMAGANPSPPAPDPYHELSLPSSATADEIRRAYKAACLRWHPDKHPSGPPRENAEARFKAVAHAYNLLADPASRAAYDASRAAAHDPFADPIYRKQFADGFAKQFAREGHSVDADSLFESLFGEGEREKFDERARRWQTMDRCEDREVELPLTLEELHSGCTKKRRLKKPDGDTAAVLSIVVRPGYRQGDRIRFKDAAVEDGRLPGDVVFLLTQRPHPRFEVDADDLTMVMHVNLVDALAGAVLVVKGLDGKDVKIRVDNVIHPGYVHTVKGRGLPRRDAPNESGDLRIRFDIAFPTRVEAEDRTAVRELFAKLDAHTNCRMSIRRSSSLFMNRGSGGHGLLNSRRSSIGVHGGGKPPVFPQKTTTKNSSPGAGGDDNRIGEEKDVANGALGSESQTRGMQPSKSRLYKTKLRFPSIFR